MKTACAAARKRRLSASPTHQMPWGGRLVFEAHRLCVSLSLRLKDLLGPATRVKKKKLVY